ncbi:unnamed protein product, partial [Urochloa humidicola]
IALLRLGPGDDPRAREAEHSSPSSAVAAPPMHIFSGGWQPCGRESV